MIPVAATLFSSRTCISERAISSLSFQSAENGAGLENGWHSVKRCTGIWTSNRFQTFQRHGREGSHCFIEGRVGLTEIEKNTPVRGEFLQGLTSPMLVCKSGLGCRGTEFEGCMCKEKPYKPHVQGVSYRPPGTQVTLLDKVSMCLPEKSLGLIYGPSGSGKTTLLQVLGGLATPTEGSIYLGKDHIDTKKPAHTTSLSARVGIVFQFPERYFLTDTIVEELLFGYSRQTQDIQLRHSLTMRLQTAVYAVGLSGISLDMNPRGLSDGYKRRLALAVQLVRMPDIMLLDEPLAGLDWKARADVVKLLSALKKDKTLILVSHDLRELTALVDKSWRMEMGGKLVEQSEWNGRQSD